MSSSGRGSVEGNCVRVRIGIRARTLGDVIVKRPCVFQVQVALGPINTSTGWLPAPASRAPRVELDFGVLEATLSADQFAAFKASRSPMKLMLLAAQTRNAAIGAAVGFVVVDGRTIVGSVGRDTVRQWFKLQNAKCQGATPEINVACRLTWTSTEQQPNAVQPTKPIEAEKPDGSYDDEEFEKESVEDAVHETSHRIESESDDKDTTCNVEQHDTTKEQEPLTAVVDSHPVELTKSLSAQVNALPLEASAPPPAVVAPKPAPAPTQFRISVDLRSVKDMETTGNVYARYVYPLFGCSAPVATHPPIQVESGREAPLPNSFCAFEFSMLAQALERTLTDDPFVVEIVGHPSAGGPDAVLGLATFEMSQLLTADLQRVGPGSVRAVDRYVPIFSGDAENDIRLVGALRFIVFLEDLGPDPGPACIAPVEQQQMDVDPEMDRGSQAYHVAWELEAWKRREQEAFKAKLALMEAERKSQLETQWTEYVTKKETALSQRHREVAHLEKRLEQALYDVRCQERLLRQQEDDLAKQKEALAREHDLQTREDAALIRSIRRQHEQEIALREKEKRSLQDRLAEIDALYTEQTEHLLAIKRKMTTSSLGKLQTELNDVSRELQAAREEIAQLKMKEKRQQSQLIACLKELARLRQSGELVENERLEKERLELQRMKVQMMARQQERDMEAERQQLQSIRCDIRRMLADDKQYRSPSPPSATSPLRQSPVRSEEYERLRAEKEELLRSGVYTSTHALIQSIDQRMANINLRAS
ncbi:DUF3668 domain-containing protein [Plasmodiophora brassicae]